LTGIAVSHSALGDGSNAANIVHCIEKLVAAGYDGVLSIECEGQGGPMIEKSLDWLRGVVATATSTSMPARVKERL
jgi:sugar phosphate isomerase/epimerase